MSNPFVSDVMISILNFPDSFVKQRTLHAKTVRKLADRMNVPTLLYLSLAKGVLRNRIYVVSIRWSGHDDETVKPAD